MFVSVVCVLLPRFELTVAAGGVRELLAGPLALAPAPGARQVVGEVSAAAEAFAVTPGLSLGEAFARCPGLKLVPPDPAAARDAWEQVVRAIETIGADVEAGPEAPGVACFETGGLERLHSGLGGVIAAVRAAVDRPLRVGVAKTRFVAMTAARTARPRKARVILTDLERREFLAAAPVDWLGMHVGAGGSTGAGAGAGARNDAGAGTRSGARAGVRAHKRGGAGGSVTGADAKAMTALAATLRKLGIETLGEFALLRRAQVAERFGAAGLTARDLVHGREPPLRPRRPAETLTERIELIDDAEGQVGVGYGTEDAFASGSGFGPGPDTTGSTAYTGSPAAGLERALDLLIERLVARPERGNRTLRGFTLSARFAEGGSWAASAVMREPTADPERIKLVLQRKLLDLPEPAASLELAADAFGPLDHEAVTLFGRDSAAERARRLKHAAEQARLAAGSPRSVARVVTLDAESRLPERRAALSPGPVPLARPRPVDLRADEDGRPLVVASPRRRRSSAAAGRRAAPRGDRDREAQGIPVAAERERWVVEDRWWTGRPVRRRYFELVLADGRDVVVFQDLSSGGWFEQRG